MMVREDNVCYFKLISNKLDNERVVGLHYLGPNAGEIIQVRTQRARGRRRRADAKGPRGLAVTRDGAFAGRRPSEADRPALLVRDGCRSGRRPRLCGEPCGPPA